LHDTDDGMEIFETTNELYVLSSTLLSNVKNGYCDLWVYCWSHKLTLQSNWDKANDILEIANDMSDDMACNDLQLRTQLSPYPAIAQIGIRIIFAYLCIVIAQLYLVI